eukprot:12922246-Prorocentrum_lima.AAC.1
MAKCHRLPQVGHVLCTNLHAKLNPTLGADHGFPRLNPLINWVPGNAKHGVARLFKQVGHRQGHGQ